MSRTHQIALAMLDEIDQARTGNQSFEELEERLWRLLDQADSSFPQTVAGQVENLVLEVKRLQRENLAAGAARDVDENRGTEVLFQEVTSALNRVLD